jgi:hypothetical protein
MSPPNPARVINIRGEDKELERPLCRDYAAPMQAEVRKRIGIASIAAVGMAVIALTVAASVRILHRRQMAMAREYGKAVHIALFALRGWESPEREEIRRRHQFPRSSGPNGFATSTAFFREVVREGLLPDYRLFAVGGVPRYEGTNPAGFTSKFNGWCVTADLDDDASEDVPYLFTRNVAISNLGDDADASVDEPFDSRGAVVVLRSGASMVFPPEAAKQFFQSGHWTNKVLRP